MRRRYFLFKDDDTIPMQIVEPVKTQKEIFDYIEQYIENMDYDLFDSSDDHFVILYKDGSYDYIDCEYDGHRIKRKNIASMVYTNSCSDVVYGKFEMNDYGSVTPAFDEVIGSNMVEVKHRK